MRISKYLSDDEIEGCIDGSSNIEMIRDIIEQTQRQGHSFVDTADFASVFAYAIEDYISADHGTEEYNEAWDNNYDWGMNIAENINQLITDKWTN